MFDVVIETQPMACVSRREIELVERKGIGHPDTICDSLMESISVRLSQLYLETCGHVCHHNLDKGLLIAGQTSPRFGGGTVDVPMRLVVGDRATLSFQGQKLPINDLVESCAHEWIRKHLRFVDPTKHLVLQNELQPGSAELVGLYDRDPTDRFRANDTSAAIGYAPLSETEHLVLAAEHYLNSPLFKQEFPETGEDVKVMAMRRGRKLDLTVAIAFVDHHIWEEATYFHRKEAVARQLRVFLETKLNELDEVQVQVNTLDRPGSGLAGMYLTVLGTSAESADGGEVGRGNRVNGLITFGRPMTLEAAAGKNPVSHVGKIYNLLARQLATQIHSAVPGVDEVYLWLCSQIGRSLDDPLAVSVQVSLAAGVGLPDVAAAIRDQVDDGVKDVRALIERLVRGELSIC